MRTNNNIFHIEQSFCPTNDRENHIAGLGLHRLDFERATAAGNVLFRLEDNDEPGLAENKITTISYLTKRMGNIDDATAFLTSLNNICGSDTDNISQQTTASYYLREMQSRDRSDVLKEMALLGFQMQALIAERDEEETIVEVKTKPVQPQTIPTPRPQIFPIYLAELTSIQKQVRRSRRVFVNDDEQMWLEGYEGCMSEEMAYEAVEALTQYDENGMIKMSDQAKPFTIGELNCVEVDRSEVPTQLFSLITRAYIHRQDNADFWSQLEAHVDNESLFQALRQLHGEFSTDLHMTLSRNNGLYRTYYSKIRQSKDVREVTTVLKEAYQAKASNHLPLKAFTMLTTAGRLQQIRLTNAKDLPLTHQLKQQIKNCTDVTMLVQRMKEKNHPIHTLPLQQQSRVWESIPKMPQAVILMDRIKNASFKQLRSESWQMYKENNPNHPIHQLPPPQAQAAWNLLNTRKTELSQNL